MSLRALLQIANENERLRALRSAVAGSEGTVDAYVSASLRPYLLAALISGDDAETSGPTLIVAADDRSARDLAGDVKTFLAPRPVHLYPSRGTTFESHLDPPPHLAGLRIAAMNSLADPSSVVVASAIALAEKVPDPSQRPETLALHRGESVDLDDVTLLLADAGYERIDQVEERGQFAVRGGILDVYPATEEQAIRVELFGDEIESMRRFSVFTQRSLGETERVELAPAAELSAEHRDDVDPATFLAALDLIPAEALVVIAAAEEIPGALRDFWEDVTAVAEEADVRPFYADVGEPLQSRARLSLGADAGQEHSFRAQRAEFPSRTLAEAEGELEKLNRSGYRTVVAFEGRGEAERTRYNLSRLDVPFLGERAPEEPGVSFAEARLREGFLSPELQLAVIPQRRLVHRRRTAQPVSARARLAAAIELRVGDYVVHEDHGIARFAGFDTKTLAGGHSRLPGARVPRGRPRLRPDRSARADQPLRRSRRRRAAAQPAGREALAEHEVAGTAGRSGDGGRPDQPLRRAPGPQGPRLLTRRRAPARPSRPPSRIARPPIRWTRSRRSRPTWSPSGRWTG